MYVVSMVDSKNHTTSQTAKENETRGNKLLIHAFINGNAYGFQDYPKSQNIQIICFKPCACIWMIGND